MSNATLYHGDCMNYFGSLPTVDAIITDPPYGKTDLHFDKDASWSWIEACQKTVKDNGYLVSFGTVNVATEILKTWKYRYSGVWLKNSGVMRTHSAKLPKSQQEPYHVYVKRDAKISDLAYNATYRIGNPYQRVQRNNGYKRDGKDSLSRASAGAFTEDGYVSENSGYREVTDVIYAPKKNGLPYAERTEHPTQKPVSVMAALIAQLTNPGDLILDPFMGSGSTAVAAIQLGRRFIGIEINPDYFAMAKKRIEDAQCQGRFELDLLTKDEVSAA